MATYKKVGSGGLWKQKGQDGSHYYSGKVKLDRDIEEGTELFMSLSKSEKRQDTSPNLWLTVKIKEEDDGTQGPLPPPPLEEDDIPF